MLWIVLCSRTLDCSLQSQTAHRLDWNTADTLRTVIAEVLRKTKPPKPNTSFKQCSAFHALRDDSNIIVPADKGKATVVMDRQDYDIRMNAILQDSKYRTLRRDPAVKVENRIADTLKRLCNEEYMDDRLYDFLTPRYSPSPHRCMAYPRFTRRILPCDLSSQLSTHHPTNLPKN